MTDAGLPHVTRTARAARGLASALFAVAMAIVASVAPAQPWDTATGGLVPIPPLTARVTDATHTLSAPEIQSLDAKLADWEARTGNQLAVLLVPTTKPEPIETYSIRVADAWKIGRKGQDNGVVVVVAKDDRKIRIEVGYGLEGVLTDVTSRRIIAENIAPAFKEGRFAAGIEAGVDRIIATVAEGKPLPPRKNGSARSMTGGVDPGSLFTILFVVVVVVGGISRAILGRVGGSTVGAGIAGVVAWFVAGSIAIAAVAGIIAFIVMIFLGAGGGLSRRGGTWIPTGGGGWGGGGSGGGGGFSGGGGSFGGGGASGGW